MHLTQSEYYWAGFCFTMLIVFSFVELWRLKQVKKHNRLMEDINKDLNDRLRKVIPWIFN